MKNIKIAIDDGHGNNTAGKRSPAFPDGSIMKENEFNAAVADLLKDELERCGFQVLMVAPEAEDVPLETRVKRANDGEADAYISLHANAYGSDWNEANGVETWIYARVAEGSETWKFAQCIHKKLVETTGLKNRGMKGSSDLYVLKNTKMHAVLVECGFMTNKEEAELLKTDAYRRTCGQAIAKGVCAFYGKEYIALDKENNVYQKLMKRAGRLFIMICLPVTRIKGLWTLCREWERMITQFMIVLSGLRIVKQTIKCGMFC